MSKATPRNRRRLLTSALLASALVAGCADPENGDPENGDPANGDPAKTGTEADTDEKIVQGTAANEGEAKFYVGTGGCGGVLVSPSFVLTARHCEETYIRNGVARPTWVNLTMNPQKFSASEIKEGDPNAVRVTPEAIYFPQIDAKDFALVKLAEPVSRAVVTPAPLSFAALRNEDAGAILTLYGMGMDERHFWASGLERAELKFVPTEQCVQDATRILLDEGAREDQLADVLAGTETMLCAVGENREDSCYGDSGGPLLNGSGEVVGVVSRGFIGCGIEGLPGLYQPVARSAGWIKRTICEHERPRLRPAFCEG
jgi:secreted trypsin-like serine protease